MIKRLNEVNDVPVLSVRNAAFAPYGRIVTGYDFSGLISYLTDKTGIPETGNVYVASVPEMEADPVAAGLKTVFYGGMDLEIGYCNGRNSTYNGFEYHKGSEINVAATDFMLVLGHTWQIQDLTFKVEDAQVFFVEKGTAIELYATTLHLSPCKVSDEGFKGVVILPRGTNTPLPEKYATADPESRLLLQRNKWVLAHPEREPLMKQGAHPGVLGENKELHY